MAYATGADFLIAHDARLIGDLVNDSGVQETAEKLPTNAVVVYELDRASAAITTAITVGNRYTLAQIASLATASSMFLKGLTCDLALIYLKRRRGRFDPEKDGPLLKECNDSLKSLREGDNTLMLTTETEMPASTLELHAPTVIPVLRRNTIRNSTRNYYPMKSTQQQQRVE